MLFSQIAELSGATVISQQADEVLIKHLLTDSRSLHFPEHTLFIAIKGTTHDGHRYLESLYAQGVRHFVIEDETLLSEPIRKSSNIIKVDRGIHFLQNMAAYKRSLFHIPVLAITGSNAKTIVKEWLWQMLHKDYTVVRSPKSYNSQLGVPLSVWEMETYHSLAIFEAGISTYDEMQYLQRIIQPVHGIFTNIGTAHDQGFKSVQDKIKEKLKLFYSVDRLIYCKDHTAIDLEVQAQHIPSYTWSRKTPSADVLIVKEERHAGGWNLILLVNKQEYPIDIPFGDEASVENVLHCTAYLLLLGFTVEDIAQRVARLEPVHMRLELKNGINGSVLIDDSYNNDLMGLTLALDFAAQHRRTLPLTVILSDVLQSGLAPEELYRSIAELLKNKNVSQLIGIGPLFSAFAGLLPTSARLFSDTTHFLQTFDFFSLKNELILVKGARSFGFEEVTKRLEEKVHGTRFEVDLDALVHNLNYYRSVAKPGTKIMAMVKAFAYGSGSHEVAQLLQHRGIDYLAVAYADEGVVLRNHGITVPIMVMNPDQQTFATLLRYRLEPEMYSFKILHEWIEYLDWENASSSVHLKLDTGMHRLGFEKKDIHELIKLLLLHKNRITVSGAFTHLAAADEELWNEFTEAQLKEFQLLCAQIESAVGYPVIKHALNSAGIVRFPQYSFDMVRLGIGLYGVEVNGMHQDKLMNVGKLITHVSQIKRIDSSETVGYSRKGRITRPTTIATIAIGYADGFDRRFSNGVGKVSVNGKLCPVIGNVCMDMTMVDVSGVEVEEGDEVIVFGDTPTLIEQSRSIGTIPYELLTGIGERVKRIFFKH
ncbi:MAG TPA: bifunctional UDP-N-acetylmuramoyl-tripeptide:D-alanyl-D-alanine ligase/alanine racemase [Cytophagaceae bacterium]|jgi:alanine racemase|nr:bifunctional UDP-N-acetylmuramoyl-tripeptide:D-alanyl-D-alanine ligase/alanine racemase [Cytophagaceae bacterium]